MAKGPKMKTHKASSKVFNKKKNGFEKVLRKIGGRLYICEKDFYAWIDSDCRLAV